MSAHPLSSSWSCTWAVAVTRGRLRRLCLEVVVIVVTPAVHVSTVRHRSFAICVSIISTLLWVPVVCSLSVGVVVLLFSTRMTCAIYL